MDVLFLINDTLAISLVLLVACSAILSAPTNKITWLVILIAFCYICNSLSARHDYAWNIPPNMQIDFGSAYVVVNLARNSISALFLLLSHALFRDNERLPRIFIALIAFQLMLEEPLAWMLSSQWEQAYPEWKYLLYEFIPACIQIVLLVYAAYWTFGEFRADLVRDRRAARVLMLALMVGQGLLSLIVERVAFTGGFISYFYMYPIHNLLVAIKILVYAIVVFWLLRRDLFDFMIDKPVSLQSVEPAIDTTPREVERIIQALEEQQIYQTMGLTVADLAKHIGTPEYRLRDLIHNHLGYRNFNSFLHHYRVEEVASALGDTSQNQTPILTLALSAGYQSINPFNRAFKELKGMTPSDYRVRQQQ